MSNFTFTLNGLYIYDNTLFDLLTLPDGMEKEVLIDAILANCGEFEPIITNFGLLKKYIGSWSVKHQHTFNKWWNAYNLEYNPINNYDRIEEVDEESHDKSVSEINGTSENKVSAFDSSSYQPDNKNDSESDSESSLDHESKHRGHLYGNIGVTTSQQMLQSEYDIVYWNIYNHIADLFADELLLQVY